MVPSGPAIRRGLAALRAQAVTASAGTAADIPACVSAVRSGVRNPCDAVPRGTLANGQGHSGEQAPALCAPGYATGPVHGCRLQDRTGRWPPRMAGTDP